MKREVLPKIISGEMRLALCLSEPDHGSDVASIELAAVREGNGYVLKGEKIYNSAAHVAHNLVVVAKTKPGRGYDGISMFLVDTSLPGVSIRRLSALGLSAQDGELGIARVELSDHVSLFEPIAL